jgi:hypothetical protein
MEALVGGGGNERVAISIQLFNGREARAAERREK